MADELGIISCTFKKIKNDTYIYVYIFEPRFLRRLREKSEKGRKCRNKKSLIVSKTTLTDRSGLKSSMMVLELVVFERGCYRHLTSVVISHVI
jgi:hypothetical protein